MGSVAKEVKAMSQADILKFENSGEITFCGYNLKLSDIKVHFFDSPSPLLFYVGFNIIQ